MIFDMKKFQENKKCTSLVERENTVHKSRKSGQFLINREGG